MVTGLMKSRRNFVDTAVLSNGMPMVHVHCPGSRVGYCGIAVKVGSRNESPDKYGLAHFVEHTIFKGTQRRRSSHIIKRMEAVGGELNAYTTKEETVIYSVFPNGNLIRAAELIGDLASNSCFPDAELDKERDVVADEIDSYLDSPADAIFDDFEDLIFEGSSLGHNILGTSEALRHFDSLSCRDFVSKYYNPRNMVAFYSGSQSMATAYAALDKYFSIIREDGMAEAVATDAPRFLPAFDIDHALSTHQTHCVLGARVPGLLDQRRYAAVFLANLLGGPGMNSLLNVELRERRGLVYSVDASTSLFSDCGLLTIYFGCDHEDIGRCREIVRKTISYLSECLTESKLAAAKKQYLGQLVVAAENRENVTLAAARSLLWRGRVLDSNDTEDAIRRLSVTDVLEASQALANPSVLTFSPSR